MKSLYFYDPAFGNERRNRRNGKSFKKKCSA